MGYDKTKKLHIRSEMKPGVIVTVFMLVLFGMVFAYPQPAKAQDQTTVFFDPAPGSITLTGTQTIAVKIQNGVNVNAMDVEILYDPALLSVDSYANGGYLSNVSLVYKVNVPGQLRLVYTQLAQPGVSGDGTLLNVVFHGNAVGLSPLTFNFVGLYDPVGIGSLPSVNHGSLAVHSDPAGIPVQNLSGTFRLQGVSDPSGIEVSLGYGQTHCFGPYTALTSSAADNNFSQPGIPQDSYLLTTNVPRCLNLTSETNKLLSLNADKNLVPLTLLCGNAVWQADNSIDVADISLIGDQYLQSGVDLDGDVNFSGRVDIFDLALAAANYGLNSNSAYAGWTP